MKLSVLFTMAIVTAIFTSQIAIASYDGHDGGYDGFEEEYSDNRILRKDDLSTSQRENYLIEKTDPIEEASNDFALDNGIDN